MHPAGLLYSPQTDGLLSSDSNGEHYDDYSASGYTINYFNLRNKIGSLGFQFPKMEIESINGTIAKLTKTYEFKNLSDYILFYYSYKHVLNHYFCKFNKIFNCLTLYKNTNKWSKFKNYSDTIEMLTTPSAYFNGYNCALLNSLNNILSNEQHIWKSYVDIKEMNSIKTSASKFIIPFGTSLNGNTGVSSKFFTDESGILTGDLGIQSGGRHNNIYSEQISNNTLIDYEENWKKLLSIYRPFYIDNLKKHNAFNGTNTTVTDSSILANSLNSYNYGVILIPSGVT